MDKFFNSKSKAALNTYISPFIYLFGTLRKRYRYLFENYSFQYKIAKIVCILPYLIFLYRPFTKLRYDAIIGLNIMYFIL